MKKEGVTGFWGIGIGAIALLIAVFSFWAGPFAVQPTVETSLAAKLKEKAIHAITGKEAEAEKQSIMKRYDIDDFIDVGTAILSAIAIIFAVISFARHEPVRVAGGAALMGATAILFKFVAMYAFALLVIVVIIFVLANLGDF